MTTFLIADQAADKITLTSHHACRIGVAYAGAAPMQTDQAADVTTLAGHPPCHVGIADITIKLIPDQATNIALPSNIDIFQPHMTQRSAIGIAKQSDIVCGSPINKQITDHMPQTIKHAAESIGVIPNRIKPRRAPHARVIAAIGNAGINISSKGVVCRQVQRGQLQLVRVADGGAVFAVQKRPGGAFDHGPGGIAAAVFGYIHVAV